MPLRSPITVPGRNPNDLPPIKLPKNEYKSVKPNQVAPIEIPGPVNLDSTLQSPFFPPTAGS
jgi:hypothetical protein